MKWRSTRPLIFGLAAAGVLLLTAAPAGASPAPAAGKVAARAEQARSGVAAGAASVAPGGQVRPLATPIVHLTNPDGRKEEFWRGADCSLWHTWQVSPGGPWSNSVGLGGCLTSDPDGTANADGRLEVFYRGTDNAIWHIWQTSPGCCWSGHASLGGLLVTGPFVGRQNGDIYVDALGPDNIWHRRIQTFPGCCWSNWIVGVPH